jgi:hypothetical protein
MPAETLTAAVTVYVMTCPTLATDPAPMPYAVTMAGAPPSPAPDTVKVTVLIVPVVAVLNEYA